MGFILICVENFALLANIFAFKDNGHGKFDPKKAVQTCGERLSEQLFPKHITERQG
jgi:hypothetical protein